MRVESGRSLKNGGWFHPFEASLPRPQPPPRRAPAPRPAPDFSTLLQRYHGESSIDPAPLRAAADRLGLSVQSLLWLRAAWARDRQALAIPMYDATCYNGSRPVGVRYRTGDGRKFAGTGSVNGIFIPYGALGRVSHLEQILICEGPTDTAAALDLGFFAFGRPACCGGEDFLVAALNDLHTAEVVIIGDNDGPGARGARELVRRIQRPKKLLTPPAKDLRTFLNLGGTKQVLDGLLQDTLRQ